MKTRPARLMIRACILVSLSMALCGCELGYKLTLENHAPRQLVFEHDGVDYVVPPCTIRYIDQSSLIGYWSGEEGPEFTVKELEGRILFRGSARRQGSGGKSLGMPWYFARYTEETRDGCGTAVQDHYIIEIRNLTDESLTINLGGQVAVKVGPKTMLRTNPLEGSVYSPLAPSVSDEEGNERLFIYTNAGDLSHSVTRETHEIGDIPTVVYEMKKVTRELHPVKILPFK